MAVLLYDGLCGFCNRAVRVVLRADRGGRVRFASLQGEYARAVVERHPDLGGIDSLVLIEDEERDTERAFVKSEALLRLARLLGGAWTGARAAAVIPRGLRDWLYDRFARQRSRLFGRYDRCPLPPPAARERFL